MRTSIGSVEVTGGDVDTGQVLDVCTALADALQAGHHGEGIGAADYRAGPGHQVQLQAVAANGCAVRSGLGQGCACALPWRRHGAGMAMAILGSVRTLIRSMLWPRLTALVRASCSMRARRWPAPASALAGGVLQEGQQGEPTGAVNYCAGRAPGAAAGGGMNF